jgi:hypothetical protein
MLASYSFTNRESLSAANASSSIITTVIHFALSVQR